MKRKLLAILLVCCLAFTGVLTGCKTNESGNGFIPDGGFEELPTAPPEDNTGDDDLVEDDITPPEEEVPPPPEIEIPKPPLDGKIPSWMIPDASSTCPENNCRCDVVCTNPEHSSGVVLPSPEIFSDLAEQQIVAADAETYYAELFRGLTATDGEGNDITAHIVIDSIDGVAFDANSSAVADMAAAYGGYRVVYSVTNMHAKTATVARNVFTVSVPTITLDNGAYAVETVGETDYIRIYRGMSVDLTLGVSASDPDDAAVTAASVQISGGVDSLTDGVYAVGYRVANKHGNAASAERLFLVRDKRAEEYTALEAYGFLMQTLAARDYTSTAKGAMTFKNAAANVTMPTSTVVTKSANAYDYVFGVRGDFYNGWWYCMNAGTKLAVTDGNATIYKGKTGYGNNGAYSNVNGVITPTQYASTSAYDMANFEADFGHAFDSQSNFTVNSETVQDASALVKANGDGTFALSLTLSVPDGKNSPSLSGFAGSMEKMLSKAFSAKWNDSPTYHINGWNSVALEYLFDAAFCPISSVTRVIYNHTLETDASDVNYTLNADYTYPETAPASVKAVSKNAKAPATVRANAFSTRSDIAQSDTTGAKENCKCGCCACCDCCRIVTEGSVFADPDRPAPVMTFEALTLRTGIDAETFQKWLYSGVTAQDGEGKDMLSRLLIAAVDGVAADTEGFDYAAFLTVGTHKIKYYAVNEWGNYTFTDRTVTIATVPEMEFLYADVMYVVKDVLIDGETKKANHTVIFTGGSYEYLSNIKVGDKHDLKLGMDAVTFEGAIDFSTPGVYSVKYTVTNSFGMTKSLVRYFLVRDRLPYEYNTAIDVLAGVKERMQKSNYKALISGSSEAAGNGIYIYGRKQHSGTETYFENMSNGGKPWGVNADFAQRAYYDGVSVRRSGASGGFGRDGATGVVIPSAWSDPTDVSTESFREAFGRGIDDIVNYNINAGTVKNPERKAVYNTDGTYTLYFDMIIDNSQSSASIADYTKQIYTISNKPCSKFYYANIAITISSDLRILHAESNEQYDVKTGVFIMPTAKTTTTTTETYEYFDNAFAVEKF